MILDKKRKALLTQSGGIPPVFPLLTNLVSFWELEEVSGNRIDAHGTNDLSPIGTPTPGNVSGVVGNAVHLIGDIDLLIFQSLQNGSDGTLIGLTDNFTFTCFFRMINTLGSEFQRVFEKGSEYGLYYDDSINQEVFFRVRYLPPYGYTQVNASNFGSLSLNTWYFLHVRYDGDNLEVGVNLVTNQVAHNLGVFPGASPFVVGSSVTCDIDQLGFWRGEALSDAHITWLRNGGAGRSYAEIAAYTG